MSQRSAGSERIFVPKAFLIYKELFLKKFSDHKTTVLHDFEMRPGSRRPKVLVQTAGHVSGAVYFYQKQDIIDSPWPDEKVLYLT